MITVKYKDSDLTVDTLDEAYAHIANTARSQKKWPLSIWEDDKEIASGAKASSIAIFKFKEMKKKEMLSLRATKRGKNV